MMMKRLLLIAATLALAACTITTRIKIPIACVARSRPIRHLVALRKRAAIFNGNISTSRPIICQ